MLPKPKHLGPEYAAQFKDLSVVEAYPHRPPYPAEVFEILRGLLPEQSRAILDVGCGTGDLARRLVDLADRIDAVDFSPAMIAKGRGLPGGDHPRLSWVLGRVEEVPLRPPYGLVTAGESLHWMDWAVVLPRLREMLAPEGHLALVGRAAEPAPWDGDLKEIISRYSTNKDFRPYDVVEELSRRGLFRKRGEQRASPVAFRQTVDDYVESMHSRNGFSRDRMSEGAAAAFDAESRRLVMDVCADGWVELRIVGVVTWGYPGKPERG